MRIPGHIKRLLLIYRIFVKPSGFGILPRLANYAFKRYLLGKRVPMTVMIALTYRCQCGCVHCSASELSNEKPELSTQEIKNIIAAARGLGVPKIGFTGGEPLLRADLPELVACAAGHGLSVSIDTNGILLSKKMAATLKEAGISNINVSLDSADPKRHDRLRKQEGCFEAALEGVKSCAALGIPAVVSTYITDKAISEGRLNDLIYTARQSGAAGVRVLFPVYTGKLGSRRRNLLSAENKKLFFEKYLDSSFVYSESPLYDCLSGAMECTMRKKMSVYVTAYGEVKKCYVSGCSMGNAREESLAAILEKNGYLKAGLAADAECGAC
ncbi:MAG: radical SAM protein [Elusimicrobiales bacterium]|nr:radical SAM protein [Elusimicrobiales bacterium]